MKGTDAASAGAPAPGFRSAAQRAAAIAWAFVVVGVLLRVYQVAANRSLFIDEAALAINIRDRSILELLAPLGAAQAAPPGFLILLKATAQLFGMSEFALRAPSLIAGAVAMIGFLFLARRVVSGWLVVIAAALFAFAPYAIFWTSDAKPYAFDVLACIVLLLLALRYVEQPTPRRAAGLAVGGAVGPYFSHGSVLVLAAIGLVLLVRAARERSIRTHVPLLGWLAAVPAVLHAMSALNPITQSYFDAFWKDGFLPLPFASNAWVMYRDSLVRFLYDPHGFRGTLLLVLITVLIAVGFIAQVGRRTMFGFVTLALLLVIVALSMAGFYPIGANWTYSGRVVLFLVPLVYLLITAAVSVLQRPILRHSVGTAIVAIIALPTIAVLPISRGEPREALRYVADHAGADDVIYLHYAVAMPLEYYRIELPGTIVRGVCSQGERRGYIADLERLRGNGRVWIVLAYDLYDERALFLEYMRRNATLVDSAAYPVADARLYDFRGSEQFPAPAELLEPIVPPDVATDCVGIFADDATGTG